MIDLAMQWARVQAALGLQSSRFWNQQCAVASQSRPRASLVGFRRRVCDARSVQHTARWLMRRDPCWTGSLPYLSPAGVDSRRLRAVVVELAVRGELYSVRVKSAFGVHRRAVSGTCGVEFDSHALPPLHSRALSPRATWFRGVSARSAATPPAARGRAVFRWRPCRGGRR